MVLEMQKSSPITLVKGIYLSDNYVPLFSFQ